jgi:hypothetical protein
VTTDLLRYKHLVKELDKYANERLSHIEGFLGSLTQINADVTYMYCHFTSGSGRLLLCSPVSQSMLISVALY